MARADEANPQVRWVRAARVPVGGPHEEMLEWSGLQEHSRAVLPHLISEGFIARRKPSTSAENPALLDAPFLKGQLSVLTQYVRTHFRRSAFLFQFLCRDRAPIEMRLRMLPKESGHEARTRQRHGPDRDAAGKKKWGAEVYYGQVKWF